MPAELHSSMHKQICSLANLAIFATKNNVAEAAMYADEKQTACISLLVMHSMHSMPHWNRQLKPEIMTQHNC